MDAQGNIIIERILQLLPAAALASAQLTCRCWAAIIMQRQLWRPHALGQQLSDGTSSAADSAGADGAAWRQVALHRAAAIKLQRGRLVLSATLPGRGQAITCMAQLEAGPLLLLLAGGADGSAGLWDLSSGRQLTLLSHCQPLVAVGLPSASLALTATRSGATLWHALHTARTPHTRPHRCLRSFQALPGCHVTCLGVTDTRLLLGSTAGAVQFFDLYSGRLQHITRHGSGITCIRPVQQAGGEQPAAEEWHIILGLADGQVCCVANSSGAELWRLPNRYPSRVVDLQLTPQHPTGQARQDQLLYVLNRRGQLICWKLPDVAATGTWAVTAAAARGQLSSQQLTAAGRSSSSNSSIWPEAICCVEAPPAAATRAPSSAASAAAAGGCTCCVVPPYGCGSVLVGSSGAMHVVALQQADISSSSSPSSNAAARSMTAEDPAAAAAAARAGAAPALATGAANATRHCSVRERLPARLPADTSHSSQLCCCLLTRQQQHLLAAAGPQAAASWCSGRLLQMQLHSVHTYSLAKLGQLLAKRPPAGSAGGGADVTCMEFVAAASGQLAVGLECGDVVLLKLRMRA